MTRRSFIRVLVLNEVADGYWSLDRIQSTSLGVAAQAGIMAGTDDVTEALSSLIRDGLVKAIWLHPRNPPQEIDGLPTPADFPKVHFFQTKAGERAHAVSFWPLDEEGNVLHDVYVVPES